MATEESTAIEKLRADFDAYHQKIGFWIRTASGIAAIFGLSLAGVWSSITAATKEASSARTEAEAARVLAAQANEDLRNGAQRVVDDLKPAFLQWVERSRSSLVPLGVAVAWTGTEPTPPEGWRLCDKDATVDLTGGAVLVGDDRSTPAQGAPLVAAPEIVRNFAEIRQNASPPIPAGPAGAGTPSGVGNIYLHAVHLRFICRVG